MSNYTIAVPWSGKDTLSDSDPAKVVSGSDFNTEFTAVQAAVNSKAELNGSAAESFSATKAPVNTDTTQVATTSFVKTAVANKTIASLGITSSASELNYLDITTLGTSQDSKALTQSATGTIVVGAVGGDQTLDIASHDEVDGGLKLAGTQVTASAAELNVLDGIPTTLSATELGYVDGVTSNIQTQIGTKAATAGSSSQTFSVATPTSSSHAATKAYVDGQTATLSQGSVQTTGYHNQFDAVVNYTVPNGSFQCGTYSYHTNQTEDRRFKTKYRTHTISHT